MLRYHQNLRLSLTLAYRIQARRSPCRGGGDRAEGRSCRGVNSVSPRSAGLCPAGRVRARGLVQRPLNGHPPGLVLRFSDVGDLVSRMRDMDSRRRFKM
jgi:hypothetical protein